MKDAPTHCQICARLIKAKNGNIAHHGYTRPGQGWQTASCFGARFRPYEVACDALPLAIASAQRYVDGRTAFLADFIANPPATIRVNFKRGSWAPDNFKELPRPDKFDSADEAGRRYKLANTYEHHFDRTIVRAKSDIKNTQGAIAEMQARLAAWVDPETKK